VIPWSIRDDDGEILEKGVAQIEMYAYGEDSLVQEVPQGKVSTHTWNESTIYPGTQRDYQVYVPAQYTPEKPAALMVFQDGLRHADPKGTLRATTVMDNLIAKGEMPITIGVFVDPGRFADQGKKEKPKNRSVEYDSLGDTYARFLLEEILPEVEKSYKISDDPKMRGIAGGSSGGICAWTVCWEKPESFGKALIWVGTFVDIRGGHNYPPMLRKTEKKPIRAYLLAGENDLDNQFGNWPLANQQMAAALKFAGYDYHFEYGQCFHGSKGAGAKLPEMLRWLWRE
jgi:enterochelin esterase-like enzyme